MVAQRSVEALDEIAEGRFAAVAKRWVTPFRSAFPDFAMEIVDLIGDRREAAKTCSSWPLTVAAKPGQSEMVTKAQLS